MKEFHTPVVIQMEFPKKNQITAVSGNVVRVVERWREVDTIVREISPPKNPPANPDIPPPPDRDGD